jgi:hypothetical protein
MNELIKSETIFAHDSTPCNQGGFSGITKNDTKDKLFNLFPNPATTQLYIDYDVEKQNASFNISDLLGSAALSGKLTKAAVNTIRIETLKPGFYMLKIIDGNTTITRKFIKR